MEVLAIRGENPISVLVPLATAGYAVKRVSRMPYISMNRALVIKSLPSIATDSCAFVFPFNFPNAVVQAFFTCL